MNPDFFINNREILKQRASARLIVITGNAMLQRNADTTYKFRQDSSFWYLTGIEEPETIVVMDGREEYIILPERGRGRLVYEGDLDAKALVKVSGIKDFYSYRDGWKRLSCSLKKTKRVGILEPPPVKIKDLNFYVNPAKRELKKKLKRHQTEIDFIDIRPVISEQRQIKQTVEIEQIKIAIDISSSAIKHVATNIDKYNNEFEIEADLDMIFRRSGASGHAFPPIVASGRSATQIHDFSNSKKLNKQDLLLLDIGAEVNNYSADIARTLAISKASSRQRDIINAVKDVHSYTVGIVQPGLSFYDFETKVESYMGKTLKKLGLIKTTNRQAIRKYFPHATSHFLGLDTHDIGDRRDAILKEGMVITVEPSILVPEENIGVRIEDDFLIKEKGAFNLSANLPAIIN